MISGKFRGHFLKSEKTFDVREGIEVFLWFRLSVNNILD